MINKYKISTALLLCTLAILIPVTALLAVSIQLQNIGIIKAIGLTVTPTSLNWGTMTPGEIKAQQVQLQSLSTMNTTLTMTGSSWNPQRIGTVSWNLQGSILKPAEVKVATFTLQIFTNFTGVTNFSFIITITATET